MFFILLNVFTILFVVGIEEKTFNKLKTNKNLLYTRSILLDNLHISQNVLQCYSKFPINQTIIIKARNCLELERGTFYDACKAKCYYKMSFLHLTQELELEHIVYGHLFPALVFLVFVANVFVVIVLSQKHMITPTNVVLKYMAIADLCVGLVPLPWNFFYYSLGNYKHEEKLELWWCYMYKYSMDAVPPVCHNIAMWLTVLLAGQRLISIQYPLLSKQLCSVRNVRLATVIIAILSILCGIPKSLDYYFDVYEGWAFEEPGRWIYLRSCLYGLTKIVKIVGSNTFFNLYFWTRVFGFILVPSILLIILNVLLIRNIRLAKRRKNRLLKEKRAREAQRQTDNNSTSIMLVVIVSIFLIVNIPQALFMAMLCVCNTFGISNQFLDGVFPVAFLLVNNMLVMATYPINFGIYCFMSSSFRDTFQMFFCKKIWRQRVVQQRVVATNKNPYNCCAIRRCNPSVKISNSFYNFNGNVKYKIDDKMLIDNCVQTLSGIAFPFTPTFTKIFISVNLSFNSINKKLKKIL